MFCPDCGHKLASATDAFCGNCGVARVAPQNTGEPQRGRNQRPHTTKGTAPTIIGILLTVGGLIGIIATMNYANRIWHSFGSARCSSCDMYGVILLLSIPALIAGVIVGVVGIVRIKNSNQLGANRYASRPIPGKGKAIASLTLGIISIFPLYSFGLLLGPIGIFLAISAKKEGYIGGMRTGGFICSIIGSVVGAFFAFLLFVYILPVII